MLTGSGKEKYIESQIKAWLENKEKLELQDHIKKYSDAAAKSKSKKGSVSSSKKSTFITLSREYGCLGFRIAEKVVEKLNQEYEVQPQWAAYDREVIDKVMSDMGLSTALSETMTGSARKGMTNLIQTTFSKFPPQVAVFRKLVETIGLLAANGNVIIVGRAGNVITKDIKGGFHVRIIASKELRVTNISEVSGISRIEAEKIITKKSKDRDSFIKKFVKHDLEDPLNYHLIFNNDYHSDDEIAGLIIEAMKARKMLKL